MLKVSSLRGERWQNIAFSLIALSLVLADQFSKAWVRSNIVVGQSVPEGAFLHITHTQNTGAAFGIFQGHVPSLTVVSFIGAGIILIYTFYLCHRFTFLNTIISKGALGAMLGGTVGNLIDRMTLGYVTDFIGVGTFPTYNISDAAITGGVGVFAGSLIYLLVKEKQEADSRNEADCHQI
ncbi:MAG: signal peptidase II [Dehalococcoidales bacterium]|nr:signal peptidase II [Dehalococcoidales bacterium]